MTEPIRLNGTPRNPASPRGAVDTFNQSPPTGYYVIVGRGFAATLNSVSLAGADYGETRVAKSGNKLPIMHIGHKDPWACYHSHGMGQFPHLLVGPGFKNRRYEACEPFEPHRSEKFAADTADEYDRIKEVWRARGHDVEERDAWVALIQPKDGAPDFSEHVQKLADESVDTRPLTRDYPPNFPPYRLLIVDKNGVSDLVYAEKIDICTGAGAPRLHPVHTVWTGYFTAMAEAGQTQGAELDQASGERKPPMLTITGFDYMRYRPQVWESLEHYGKDFKSRVPIISSQHALLQQIKRPYSGTRVAVFGGGGVGVNLMETFVGDRVSGGPWWLDWYASSNFRQVNAADRNRQTYFFGGTKIADPRKGLLPSVHDRDQYDNRRAEGEEHTPGLFTHGTTGTGGAGQNRTVRIKPYSPFLRMAVNVTLAAWVQETWGSVDLKAGRNPSTIMISTGSQEQPPDRGKFEFVHSSEQLEIAQDRPFHDATTYSQTIFSAGQVPPMYVGGLQFLVSLLGAFSAIRVQGNDPDNRLVGLQSTVQTDDRDEQGDIRLLGVCVGTWPSKALNSEDDEESWKAASTYESSLPEQGQAGRGLFPFNAICVALANRFYHNNGTEHINPSINTTTQYEMQQRGLEENVADRLVTFRSRRSEGIACQEDLQDALEGAPDEEDLTRHMTDVKQKLSLTYPPEDHGLWKGGYWPR